MGVKRKDWDRVHANTASTRLSTVEYQALREYCAANGTTVFRLLREYLTAIVEENKPLW